MKTVEQLLTDQGTQVGLLAVAISALAASLHSHGAFNARGYAQDIRLRANTGNEEADTLLVSVADKIVQMVDELETNGPTRLRPVDEE